jgi:iron complex transport system ATP-binding protein
MLEVKNYSNYILKDIELNITNGENLIILGSNGCGKTTLAKIISGIIENNHVKINNKKISTLYGKNRTTLINYIPPKLDIFDDYITVFEFLRLNSLHNSISIEEVLNLINIQNLKNKSCKFLSSGESQLVLLASAILHGASFTIFDEITSNLDPTKLKMVFDILKSNQFFESKIIITHNLHMAYKLGFDIIFMQDGKIIFKGQNQEFFEQKSLDKFFDGSIQKIDDNIVVNI